MSKRSGSYASILRGVSQQPPEQRLPGQHGEQVNMVSDPVAGVARRQGSTFIREAEATAVFPSGYWTPDLEQSFSTAQVKVLDREYTMHYRRPGTTGTTPPIAMVRCGTHRKADGTLIGNDGEFAPVVISAAARALLNNGVNAHAVAGEYMLLAHTGKVASTRTEELLSAGNMAQALVQVRGGAYNRKYTIKFKLDSFLSPAFTVEYTTPASSYAGSLDTTSIAASDPAYTKKVNDLVNAYNSAVTAYIGQAAAAIQPQAIAQQLAVAFLAAGGTAQGIGVAAEHGVLRIQAPAPIKYIEVYDGGDGSLLKGTFLEVEQAEDLPPYSFTGKIVHVGTGVQFGAGAGTKPAALAGNAETTGYYLKAVSSQPVGAYAQVVWQECSDATVELSNVVCMGLEYDGEWIIGASPSDLSTAAGLRPLTNPVPTFAKREAGDDESNEVPHFVGRAITYMGIFQDRLLVGSDNVINASVVGSYFSFFRTTVLTVPDDDPVEMFATGTEGDTLRHGTVFDKSLILFGDLAQYAIPGSVPLTPSTSFIMQSSRHIAAAALRPVSAGNLVFYVKADVTGAALHQINVGNVDDTSNSSEVSVQLGNYMSGTPQCLVALSSPTCIVMTLRERPRDVFVFRYIDTADGQRQLDAWYRWEFNESCGSLIGVSNFRDKLRLHFLRSGRLVVDEISMHASDNVTPHLDSIGAAATRLAGPDAAAMHVAWGGSVSAARRWQGNRAPTRAALEVELGAEAPLYAGIPFESNFTPTPPVLRDQNEAPITTGNLVIASLAVTYRDTGGLRADVATDWGSYPSAEFIGLTVDGADSLVGRRALQRGVEDLPVEQNSKEYALTIRSIDWLPLSVTSIDWVGQSFNRTRRA